MASEHYELCVFDTEIFADSVEWCPIEGYHDILVCGTYQLEEEKQDEKQQRFGKIYLFKWCTDGGQLQLLHTEHVSGVLDLKWCGDEINHKVVLGAALASGKVAVYQLLEAEHETCLHLMTECQVSDGLALSLDWSSNTSVPKIAVSDSLGMVSILQLEDSDVKVWKKWKAHGFEAWITAFCVDKPGMVFSGGDDCILKAWDAMTESQIWCSKRHTMGVTSLHSSQHLPQLASGSYDEQVLFWDCRALKLPQDDVNVGGGVWRIKWDPWDSRYLVTASMHAGFHVIKREGVEIVKHYTSHSSLGYGADWSRSRNKSGKASLATCSFYDHQLRLWDVDMIQS